MLIKIVQPDYYEEFVCIGPNCRASCCTLEWDIYIDKNTYKRYKSLSNENSLNKDFKKYMMIQDRGNRHLYAKIHNDNDFLGSNFCPFLDEFKLCKIHSSLGENELPYICKTYPRILNNISFKNEKLNYFEKTCSISCEEVVNIFLKKNDYIEYKILEENLSKNYIIDNMICNLNNKVDENKREIIKYYAEIRGIIIAVLQNREYSFEDRLILLAIFCEKLNIFEKNNMNNKVLEYINEFVRAVDNRSYDSILNINLDNDSGYVFSFAVLNNIVNLKNIKNKGDILNGIFENLQKFDIKTVDEYKKSTFVKNYKFIIKEREIFIEHIFVNEVYTRMIPFNLNYDIFENVQILVSIYLFFRLILSGMLGDKEFITDDELVNLTAFFGKSILHSNIISDLFLVNMKEMNMNSLASLIILIKG